MLEHWLTTTSIALPDVDCLEHHDAGALDDILFSLADSDSNCRADCTRGTASLGPRERNAFSSYRLVVSRWRGDLLGGQAILPHHTHWFCFVGNSIQASRLGDRPHFASSRAVRAGAGSGLAWGFVVLIAGGSQAGA
jgi:hypothetical protein